MTRTPHPITAPRAPRPAPNSGCLNSAARQGHSRGGCALQRVWGVVADVVAIRAVFSYTSQCVKRFLQHYNANSLAYMWVRVRERARARVFARCSVVVLQFIYKILISICYFYNGACNTPKSTVVARRFCPLSFRLNPLKVINNGVII